MVLNLLKSHDPEMNNLAVVIFCEKNERYMDYVWVVKAFGRMDQVRLHHYFNKMLKCVR
jgi:hypothetical protein